METYCAVPCLGDVMRNHTYRWLQVCCVACSGGGVGGSCEVETISPGCKDFCWFRLCCAGLGIEYDLQSGALQCCKPMVASICCCIQTDLGLVEAESGGLCLNPMKDPWCTEKFLCIQSYCGIGPGLAQPCQVCCVLVQTGMGKKFDPKLGQKKESWIPLE